MVIIYQDELSTVVKEKCPLCGQYHQVSLDTEGFIKWADEGVLIQKAMPNVPIVTREFLITGFCPSCQEKIFGEN